MDGKHALSYFDIGHSSRLPGVVVRKLVYSLLYLRPPRRLPFARSVPIRAGIKLVMGNAAPPRLLSRSTPKHPSHLSSTSQTIGLSRSCCVCMRHLHDGACYDALRPHHKTSRPTRSCSFRTCWIMMTCGKPSALPGHNNPHGRTRLCRIRIGS